MREHRQIVERWQDGSALMLVTLIRVQGSSYRKPSARLLICKDGTHEGSVSAGCLEADLLRKAMWFIRNGPTVQRYSTLFDETSEMPFGLGCGGVLDLLLESVDTAECKALLQTIESTLSGREHLVTTWLPKDNHPLMRAVFRADGELIFASNGLPSESLSKARKQCLLNPDAEIEGVFGERLVPPQRLFLFGAGEDARPIVTIACLLGWSVTVIDRRTHLALKARFPESNVEVVSIPVAALQQINTRDAVVIMTHSYEQDSDYLTSLLPLRPRYLGLLGSRQRSSLLIADTAAKLDLSAAECCEQVCAPVGLDLGGEGPEAIALAIIAEVQACCRSKRNESRKLSAEHIQHYLDNCDPQIFVKSQCGLSTI